jgi:hypothetical protein
MTISGGNLTIGGVVSGATYGITKTGFGTLDFNSASVNTFGSTSGTLTINAGTIEEDFTTLGSTANLLEPTLALSMGGGTLFVNGGGSTSTSAQTFASTAFTSGESVINAVVNGTSTTVNLNAFTLSAGATLSLSSSGTFTTTTLGGGALGLLGTAPGTSSTAGYATYGTSDWPTTDLTTGTAGSGTTTIRGLSAVTGGYVANSFPGTGQGANCNLTANFTASANTGTTTVRFNTPAATTVNNNNKYCVVSAFLITPNMGANNASYSGATTWFANYSSTAAQNGYVWQNNTLGYFNIASTIGNGRDNTGAPLTYIQSGPGTVVISGNGAGSKTA